MNVGIASDHRGYELKQKLTEYLINKKYNVINYGTDSIESVDYPDFVLKVAENINNKNVDFGIVLCGTGIGVSIACNKIRGIRCAKVNNVKEAKLARNHNDANIIALNGDLCFKNAKNLIDTFLSTEFSNEERHIRRINKITRIEEENNL